MLHIIKPVVIGLPHVDLGTRNVLALGVQNTSFDQHPLAFSVKADVGPHGRSGASGTWNGPSTVLSEAPQGLRLLIASTSIDTPSTSDSKINSCRQSSHLWPVSVRNMIACNHSSCVGSTSFTAACIYDDNRNRIAIIQIQRPFLADRIVSAMDEHLAIISALEARNVEDAVAAIRQHLVNTLRWWGV